MKTSLSVVLLGAALAGCNATPLEYHSPQDIPRGPGMFSGADGGLTMRTGDAKAIAQADAPGSSVKPAAPTLSAEEYREFQEWREWRRAREEALKK